MIFWHFCCKHSAQGVDRDGYLRPNPQPALRGIPLVWLTDLDVPDAEGLGLTNRSGLITCNRTECMYVVETDMAESWTEWVRWRGIDRLTRDAMELYGRPRHWFLVEGEVPVLERVC